MARQLQQRSVPPPSVNTGMSMSASGRAALAAREGLGGRPGNAGGAYNDSADNCTVGIGTLVHYGPCTAAELSRPANAAQNQADFDARVRVAEDAVRNGVPGRLLNQNQFDALVSAAYNSGGGMTGVFAQADRGNDIGVVDQMRRNVIIHRHDAQAHRVGPPVVSRGLINRRAGEVAQYSGPIAPVPAHGRP